MDERRKFRRVQTPVLCRPVGKPLFGHRKAVDVSEGGMRLFADEAPDVGDRLELELSLPGAGGAPPDEAICTVEVVWIDPLPADAPARFDVGVKFVQISDAVRLRIASVLQPE